LSESGCRTGEEPGTLAAVGVALMDPADPDPGLDAGLTSDLLPCGYVATSPDGLILGVNETFLRLIGRERASLVGRRTFADLLSGGGRIYHETHYAPMLRLQGSVRAIALDLVRSDGARVPVLVNSVLDRTEDGSPALVRTAVFDATDRREYEQELLRAKQRAEQSEARATALSHALQSTLIPPATPRIPGLDVAAAYRPAGDGSEVGGDFYDIFPTGDREWVVLLGDVSGKGVDAAIVTGLTRHLVREAVVGQDGPAAALRVLNQALYEHETDHFCTALLLRLRPGDHGTWTVTMSIGGHPLPLLRSGEGRVEAVGIPGSALGLLPEVEVADAAVELTAGQTLVLYTDGVTEARRRREFFGESQLVAAVEQAGATAEQTVSRVVDEVLAFQDQFPRDDIALVALRVPHVY
jgi:sigma-B regulation protein RsbU (phosphoserine phosphatase)